MQTAAAEATAPVKASLEALRRKQSAAHRDGQSATQTAEAIADDIAALAIDLYARARAATPEAPPTALVALGSLGRREMSPYSDVDLAVITGAPEDAAVKRLVERLLYPLWDAGLDVGHAVRAPSEFARLAESDDTVRTSALDRRPLAGDATVLSELSRALDRALRGKHTRRYVVATVAEWTDQHSPATVHRLEPNLKTGPGGLRELQRVWWMARLVWRIEAWSDLVSRHLVDPHDHDVLMQGREVMLSLRLALHATCGRRQDQLRFDLQSDVARHLGLRDERKPAADQLLELFYRHAKAVRAAATRVLESCAESLAPSRRPRRDDIEGFACVDQRLALTDAEHFERAPEDLVRIFRVAQTHGLALHRAVRARISEGSARLLTPAVVASPTVARTFLDLLGDPRRGGESLELMHEGGVLERVLPELQPVTGLVQRDSYHTFTVDAHLVACAGRAMALMAGRADDTPAEIEIVANHLDRPHLLVLGALLHDIGKGGGHGHSERGARLAAEVAARLGLGPTDSDDLVFLVEEHLTLFKLSQRRDLEDPSLLAQLAARVESPERLDLLYVLSFCDAITTGPAAWSAWKGALLHELYVRAREALRGGAGASTLQARAQARLAGIRAELGETAEAVTWLAPQVGPRHLVAHRPAMLLRHAEALRQAQREGGAVTLALDALRGGWEIVVVGPDRAGLLSDLAAVLAAWGVNIDAAQISSTLAATSATAAVAEAPAPVWAIDTFVVRPGEGPALEAERKRAALRSELLAALAGPVDVSHRLQERRRSHAATRARGAPAPSIRVVYDDGVVADATVLDVFAPDRVGLLHDIAEAIHAAGASITLARITTEGERAVDAFYVVDAIHQRPLDEAARQRLAEAVTARVGAPR